MFLTDLVLPTRIQHHKFNPSINVYVPNKHSLNVGFCTGFPPMVLHPAPSFKDLKLDEKHRSKKGTEVQSGKPGTDTENSSSQLPASSSLRTVLANVIHLQGQNPMSHHPRIPATSTFFPSLTDGLLRSTGPKRSPLARSP